VNNVFWLIAGPAIVQTSVGATHVQVDWADPRLHVGRFEDGGRYCLPCRRTLCVRGEASILGARAEDWRHACPMCGREVGDSERVGAFRWASDPAAVRALLEAPLRQAAADAALSRAPASVARGENGERYTARQLLGLIEACPVQLLHQVGERWL
jgi:hypothetical protein